MSEKLDLIVNSEDYYFQKLENEFELFKGFQITNEEIEVLINNVSDFYKNNDSKENKFVDFIATNKIYKDFLELIGRIISMCDLNASNKEQFNPYIDKRTVAKAGVRQNDWIINLLKYKKDGLEVVSPSIKSILEYIIDPENNLTVLSQNHKDLISEKLLKKNYRKDSFVEEIKKYFTQELNKYKIQNKKNLTIVISNLIYSPLYKDIWLSEKIIEESFKKWLINTKQLSDNT